jgi:short-subunit dehydrogenase
MTTRVTQGRGTALVTGASTGIGLELAKVLALNGHPLVIVARNRERLNALARQLESEYGISVIAYAKDLSQPDAANDLWAEVSKSNFTLDFLVNNAGVGVYGEFQKAPAETLQRMQVLNVLALTTLTRLALPGMLERKRGRILNLASMVSYQPGGPQMAVYYATKAYVMSFSEGLGRELKGSGVTVTALCPGPTRTAFEENSGAGETLIYRYRLFPTAKEVAAAGYRGMMRGQRAVLPGLMTKLLAFAGELTPRTVALEVNRYLLRRA